MSHPYTPAEKPDDEIIRVPFGSKPTETVPLEWASAMLAELKRRNPKLFGELLTGAIGIERKPRGGSN